MQRGPGKEVTSRKRRLDRPAPAEQKALVPDNGLTVHNSFFGVVPDDQKRLGAACRQSGRGGSLVKSASATKPPRATNHQRCYCADVLMRIPALCFF